MFYGLILSELTLVFLLMLNGGLVLLGALLGVGDGVVVLVVFKVCFLHLFLWSLVDNDYNSGFNGGFLWESLGWV